MDTHRRGLDTRASCGARRALRGLCALALLCAALPATARAQGHLSGRVVMDSSRKPVALASVQFPAIGRGVQSDSVGQFLIRALPAGQLLVVISAPGLRPESTFVNIQEGQELVRSFEIGRPVTRLGAVRVTEKALTDPTGFKDRKAKLHGTFLDQANLKGRSLAYALSTVSGVRVQNGGASQAFAINARDWERGSLSNAPRPGCATRDAMLGRCAADPSTRSQSAMGQSMTCYMDVYIDGTAWYVKGTGIAPYDLNNLQTAELDGVEVYTNAGDLPARFSRSNSECGAILIWTKR